MTPTVEQAMADFHRIVTAIKVNGPSRMCKNVVDDAFANDPSLSREEWEALYDAEFPGEVA